MKVLETIIKRYEDSKTDKLKGFKLSSSLLELMEDVKEFQGYPITPSGLYNDNIIEYYDSNHNLKEKRF